MHSQVLHIAAAQDLYTESFMHIDAMNEAGMCLDEGAKSLMGMSKHWRQAGVVVLSMRWAPLHVSDKLARSEVAVAVHPLRVMDCLAHV
jgi:hypothetical protein